jgi:hypothetical protein
MFVVVVAVNRVSHSVISWPESTLLSVGYRNLKVLGSLDTLEGPSKQEISVPRLFGMPSGLVTTSLIVLFGSRYCIKHGLYLT